MEQEGKTVGLTDKQKFVAAIGVIRELIIRGDTSEAVRMCEQAMSDALVLPKDLSEATVGQALSFGAEFRQLCKRHDVKAAAVMGLPTKDGPGLDLRLFGERSVLQMVERALMVEEAIMQEVKRRGHLD